MDKLIRAALRGHAQESELDRDRQPHHEFGEHACGVRSAFDGGALHGLIGRRETLAGF